MTTMTGKEADVLRDLAGSYVRINQTDLKKAECCVDLGAFLYAHDHNTSEFGDLKKGFNLLFESFHGQALWSDILTAATQGLSSEETNKIETSPASTCLKKSFVEIVKNACDERILNHSDTGSSIVKLNLVIDTTVPDKISMTITDNGRGFPQPFLDKVASPSLRDNYMRSPGSEKERGLSLFGGAGLGLRNLIAEVEHGADLDKLHIIKKYHIENLDPKITFDNNREGSGASITITMSDMPLQLLAEKKHELDIGDPELEAIMMAPPKNKYGLKKLPANIDVAKENQAALKEELNSLKRKSPQSVTDVDSLSPEIATKRLKT